MLPLPSPPSAIPSSSSATSARVVTEDDAFTAAQRRATGPTARSCYVPRGVRLEAPIVLTAVAARPARAQLAHADRARGGRRGRGLGAVRCRPTTRPRASSTASSSSSSARTRSCASSAPRRSTRRRGSSAPSARSSTRDGTLDWVALGFGSAQRQGASWRRKLAGRGRATRTVTGAYATRGRQHLDFDTLQEHAAPNTTSDLAFRGILGGRSSAVWRGMIKVDPGAQQTDAFQESRNLLLSKKAHADAIPGLEILANDVRCTHAAAIAQIDREQLFYLRSRGLDDADGDAARRSRASWRSSSSASRRARSATPSRRRSSGASPRARG